MVVLAPLGGEIALVKSSPAVYFITAHGEVLGGEGRDCLLHRREQKKKN